MLMTLLKPVVNQEINEVLRDQPSETNMFTLS